VDFGWVTLGVSVLRLLDTANSEDSSTRCSAHQLGIETLSSGDCAYPCKIHADKKLTAIQPDYRVVKSLHRIMLIGHPATQRAVVANGGQLRGVRATISG
jgi:hypothetical protein